MLSAENSILKQGNKFSVSSTGTEVKQRLSRSHCRHSIAASCLTTAERFGLFHLLRTYPVYITLSLLQSHGCVWAVSTSIRKPFEKNAAQFWSCILVLNPVTWACTLFKFSIWIQYLLCFKGKHWWNAAVLHTCVVAAWNRVSKENCRDEFPVGLSSALCSSPSLALDERPWPQLHHLFNSFYPLFPIVEVLIRCLNICCSDCKKC